jgi:hypothetical protein
MSLKDSSWPELNLAVTEHARGTLYMFNESVGHAYHPSAIVGE